MKTPRKAIEAKRRAHDAPLVVHLNPETVAASECSDTAAIDDDLIAQIPEDAREIFRQLDEAYKGISLFEVLAEPDDLEWRRLHQQVVAELGPFPRPPQQRMSAGLGRQINEWMTRRAQRPPVDHALIAQWIKDRGGPVVVVPVVESKAPDYTGGMGNEAAEFHAVADDALNRGLTVAELKEAIEDKLTAKAQGAARETTTRATATPRLKWEADRLPDENPASFAWRAYQPEAKAGTLHLGVIRQDDKKNGTDLAVKLVSWLRSPANRQQAPEGFDIPTLPEWNTRQLAKLDEPASRETLRLHQIARRRRERAAVAHHP